MSADFPDWAHGFQTADPDRAAALLLLPPEPRRKLVALYAVANEMHRAARASQEPALSAIRLQWWVEALQSLPDGAGQHPVLGALVEEWGAEAPTLARLGEGERGILDEEGHDEILARIDATAGEIAWIGAALLGAGPAAEAGVRAQGRALGVAAELMHWTGEVEPLREAGKAAAREAAAAFASVPRRVAPVLFAGPAAQASLLGKPEPADASRRFAIIRFALTRNWRVPVPD